MFRRVQPVVNGGDFDSSAEIIDDTPDQSPARPRPTPRRQQELLLNSSSKKSGSGLEESFSRARSPQVIPDSDSDCSEAGDDSGLLDQAVSQGDASLLTDDDSDDDLPLVRQKVASDGSSGEESGDEEFSAKDGMGDKSISAAPVSAVAKMKRARGRHDDSLDSPMVRATMARTCQDSLDTPVSGQRFSSRKEDSSLRSPSLRSPTKRISALGSPMNISTARSPTYRSSAKTEEQDSPVIPQSLMKAKDRRRISSDTEEESGGDDLGESLTFQSPSRAEEQDSPVIPRSVMKNKDRRRIASESEEGSGEEEDVPPTINLKNKDRRRFASESEEESGEEGDMSVTQDLMIDSIAMYSEEESDDEPLVKSGIAMESESEEEESFASAEESSSRPGSRVSAIPSPPDSASPSPRQRERWQKDVTPAKTRPLDDSVCITPPPSSPTPPPKPAPKPRRNWEEEEDDVVIELSDSDDDEFNKAAMVPSFTTSPAKAAGGWGAMEGRELEMRIQELERQKAANQMILKNGGVRMPNGGAGIRRTIEEQTAEVAQLRKRLLEARGRMGSVQPSTSLGAVPKFAPIDNQPSATKLQEAKKSKTLLLASLDFAHHTKDGGAQIQRKLEEVDKRIEKLEKEAEAEARELHSNVGWNKFKAAGAGLGGMTADEMLKQLMEPQETALYGGKMTDGRRQEVRTVSRDAMETIKRSLETMPGEADEEEQPRGLRSKIQLFPYQRHALAWLLWRETQEPRGGILADDMGLGKTLTMVSLVLKHREVEDEREAAARAAGQDTEEVYTGKLDSLVKSRTTLIICPASLLGQWSGEVESKVKSGHLRVLVYHGAGRKQSARGLAKYDIVITTYGTVGSEVKDATAKGAAEKESKVRMEDMKAAEDVEHVRSNKSELLNVVWERIILDEAHVIRNPKTLNSLAVCKLRAVRRWCVTGTPIQNKELDLYSLVRFMRYKPWDEYAMWKKWIETKSPQGQERMNVMVKSCLLRRTKDQVSKVTGKVLVDLPEKHKIDHLGELAKDEMEVFERVKLFAKAAVDKFMAKAEEKKMLAGGGHGSYSTKSPQGAASSEYAFQPGALAGLPGAGEQEVKSHHILVLLLRLRQICNHPCLIKAILADEEKEHDGLEGDADLISAMEDLKVEGGEGQKAMDQVLRMDNPVFIPTNISTKIKVVLEELQKLVVKRRDEGVVEKAIIVSQWTSMLQIVKQHMKPMGIKVCEITGQVPVKDRGGIVDEFNNNEKGAQVMLLSLAAGGVGLNLVGANHLFLIDCHWNPQLEAQAFDRIYRVGQKKEVFIHRFVMKGTVEEKIMALQEKKLKLAEGVLTGAKRKGSNKLTTEELVSLFS